METGKYRTIMTPHDALATGPMGYIHQLGYKEWIRLHGKQTHDKTVWNKIGWKWTPTPCGGVSCKSRHVIATDRRTRRGVS